MSSVLFILKLLATSFLVYLIFHLYIFQCAYLVITFIVITIYKKKEIFVKQYFYFSYGGAKESRTPDLLLARQAL